MRRASFVFGAVLTASVLSGAVAVEAAPQVTRLNPPSRVFSNLAAGPVTSRFLPDQRFDLQATIQADAGQTITSAQFFVDGVAVSPVINTGLVAGNRFALVGIGTDRFSVAYRAYRSTSPGVHALTVVGQQSDGASFTATGNFEIVGIGQYGRRAKNIIYLIGDGMGIAHRTAARLMLRNAAQGKANGLLSMDTFPYTGMVMTYSLNSIVTDSSPGAACYSTGNKSNNNQHGVFPDDTADNFDNPRVEHLAEYLARKQGKALGIVTTSDVFDATPASFATHTQSRGAGTGIIDQFLLEGVQNANLRVLMGGGRRWFLPANTAFSSTAGTLLGSSRGNSTDYVLGADVVTGWNVPAGTLNAGDNVIDQFVNNAGFTFAANATELSSIPGNTSRLLGLFANGNMNIALDKVAKRRGALVGNQGGINPNSGNFVVDEYGFPNQPMLDEMAGKALQVLSRNGPGFVLMIEGASIDKQAHNMDSERFMLDTIEFDRAIEVCRQFAMQNPDTLVVVTADHECGGVAIIGASTLSNQDLITRSTSGGGAAQLRNGVVGTYDAAGFPVYTIAADGYPTTTDPNRKMLIGYGANADRNEDWLTNPLPLRDGQSILSTSTAGQVDYDDAPLSLYPSGPLNRDLAGAFSVTGQIGDGVAAHTASDVPLSALGRGSLLFTGVMDNTDVFFRVAQAILGGAK